MAKTKETAETAVAPSAEEIVRAPQQERGQRRVDSILDAAEQVIAEVGVDAATTNAIAERAGASMGSLYHFFPGKDAIVLALARRYAERMRDLNATAMTLDGAHLPLPVLFENIIWGHVGFIDRTPAFAAVQEATIRKYGTCAVSAELDEAIIQQVRTFLEVRYPAMDASQRLAATRLSVLAVGKTVEATVGMPREDREAMLRELRDMLVRYFAPLDVAYGDGNR
jgi:AcrR family transcriptional regulator